MREHGAYATPPHQLPTCSCRQAFVTRSGLERGRHASIEEMVFYPEIRTRLTDDLDMVLEALEEHHVVKWVLSELERMSSTDERYTAKVTVLIESVRHHVKEEERDLFPKVRKSFTRAELDELGQRLTAAKSSAPSRPHPRSPDTPPGNIVAAVMSAPLDAAVKVAGSAANRVRRIIS